MDSYKVRKTPIVCSHPRCVRLTRRYNGLCVRHRNDTKLIKLFNSKSIAFQQWRDILEDNSAEDSMFEDWEILKI